MSLPTTPDHPPIQDGSTTHTVAKRPTLEHETSFPGATTCHTFLDKLRLGCSVVGSPGVLNGLLSNAVHPAQAAGNELRVLLAARQAKRGVREISVPALGERQVVGAVEAVPLQRRQVIFVEGRGSFLRYCWKPSIACAK